STNLQDLARDASRIVHGRVLSLRPNPLGNTPCTDVTLQVAEAWKGVAAGTVTFSILGGEAGGEHVDVDGGARFTPGEDVVVCLDDSPWSGRAWVDGGEQGKVQVAGGRIALTGTPLASFRAYLSGAIAGSPAPLAMRVAADSTGPHITSITPNPVGSAG